MTLPHLRILEPHAGLFAYYDGRIAGYRFDPRPNWVDEGGLGLGIASYALIHDSHAIVYDTGTTPAHGRAIAAHLKGQGVQTITIVYSHWHKDHVAGTAQILDVFPDSPVLANTRTFQHLSDNKADLESSRRWPAIKPLVLPTKNFETTHTFMFGPRRIELILHNIHSDDASVLWLPNERILLAGDTLEDPITYVDEPQDFACHLTDLDRLESLKPAKILPCHGNADVIDSGGYAPTLITATQSYTRWLAALSSNPSESSRPIEDILADHFAANHITWFEPYAAVHAANVDAALKVSHG
ncbi:MBL fold metallo-hydrolase [Roseobacter sp. N2S]|uniref:MBL fold metallo-hydrolase n=1 Tax=Roseobacter sp. N2S TaxID=2663844 RepID=UPI002854E571|nr:MBL fold metallo-hydrolase [Roseobacter sp. N2S]MDR6265374.1 glyoxylase-like metal-dependent hydrolase (beta-lactamase superfamily II) [Roseobacter sp. N2S]